MVSPISMMIADTSATFTATLVISGIVVVLGILILLIFVMLLFGVIVPKIEQLGKKRADKKAAKKAAKAGNNNETVKPAPVQSFGKPAPTPAPVVEQGISGEVVAAIAAAVTAYEGKDVVIRSIKKKNVGGRNPWAAAAVNDNTRPF
ncbi:MAG: OadG family protein [Eubacterium sp.]|nr:OadG family protein [Eubacterium sp.]